MHAETGSIRLDPQAFLKELFSAALAAVDPLKIVPDHLPPPPKNGRTVVVGAGKAAARMAQAVEENWDGPLTGLVVTRYGHGADCRRIEVVEAGHPVPDEAGAASARRIMEMVSGLGADDLVICLISGGGSSLLTMPAEGISLEDKRSVNRALLKSGATISEMNCVRRHLSAIKGGRLALACGRAKLVTLIVSDVPGDDPAVVASGPTVFDKSTAADALEILERHAIAIPESVRSLLRRRENEVLLEATMPNCSHTVIATAQLALDAAAGKARESGVMPLILGNSLEGESRDVGLVHAAIARQIRGFGQPVDTPAVILSGGETTVTVRGEGRGGRNAEFILSLAIGLAGLADVYGIACDTDGIDGSEDNAGAMVDPDTVERGRVLGISANEYLSRNDAYSYFEKLGDLVVTGPTRTNVNDFRAILVL